MGPMAHDLSARATGGTGAAASDAAALTGPRRGHAQLRAPLGAEQITRSRHLGCFSAGVVCPGPVDQIIACLFEGSLPGQAPVGTPFETGYDRTTTPPNSPPAAQVLLVCLFKRYSARQRRRPRARSRHLSIAPMVHADRGRRAVEVRRLFFVYGGEDV